MLEISGKTNLLEQNAYKYSLQDVAEPNLQRDIYTQGMVPKVPFNHRRVPMNMPEEIWITDTSLRDGQQSVEPYTVDQIVNIYKYLSRLGGPYGIIRQTEFFIYSKKDREALEKCMELGLKFPEITTWIRATKEDFRLVRDLGIRETGILVSCSDYHIFKKMKMTRKQAMDYYLATVADAFYIMYYLNRACEIQMATAQLAALSPIHTIAPHLSQHACEQLMGVEHERQQVWQAWLRRLDRLDTSYKD
jgi:hypothetical protein